MRLGSNRMPKIALLKDAGFIRCGAVGRDAVTCTRAICRINSPADVSVCLSHLAAL